MDKKESEKLMLCYVCGKELSLFGERIRHNDFWVHRRCIPELQRELKRMEEEREARTPVV